jgi:hypothetical protein
MFFYLSRARGILKTRNFVRIDNSGDVGSKPDGFSERRVLTVGSSICMVLGRIELQTNLYTFQIAVSLSYRPKTLLSC